jgi:hypothetical protein
MGQQNNIIYGVIVTDEKGTILDSNMLGKVVSLREGEKKPLSYNYVMPKTITGDVKVFLTADTEAGLNLSSYTLYEGNISGENITFPCSYTPATKTSAGKIDCVSPKDISLNVEYRIGSTYNTPTSTQTVALKSGEKITLKPALAPGSYFATMVDTSTNSKRTFPITVAGEHGSILSVVVNDGDKSGTLKAVVFSDVSVPSSVSVKLTDQSGTVCGEGSSQAFGQTAEVSVDTTCSEGTAEVTLKNEKGKVLDTTTEQFSITSVFPFENQIIGDATGGKTMFTSTVWWLGGLILALLAVLASLYLKRNKAVTQESPVINP